MIGWYLKSTTADKRWNEALSEWGWSSMHSFYRYIYELQTEPISQGTELTSNDWKQIDINTNPNLSSKKGYWIKLE